MSVRLYFLSMMRCCEKVSLTYRGVHTVALNAFNVRDALNARKIFFVGSEKTMEYLKSYGEKIAQHTT